MIYVNNTEILHERRRGLRPAVTLFYYLKDKIDAQNVVNTSKEELARALNVCPRTLKNWLYSLRQINVIKYKYSGKIQINPDIYFSGSEEQRKAALETFRAFKSDI